MTQEVYRYTFAPGVPIEDVEASLLLALWGTQSLHGEVQSRLDAAHYLDPRGRACLIDAGTPVGFDFNRLFLGFLQREFGPESFRVERVTASRADHSAARPSEEVSA